MKKKIITVFILVTIIFINCCNIVNAQTTITATSSTVKSEKEITVTVKSSVSLAGYTVSLISSGDCTFKSVSAPSGVNGNSNGSTIGGTSSDGTKNLAIYKFTAPAVTKNTKYTIKFEVSAMLTADDEEITTPIPATATITVEAPKVDPKPDPEPEQEPEPPKVEEPNFKNANKTMYASKKINLRASWSTDSQATSIEQGTELTVTATSSNKVNGYVWYKVKYSGKTYYVASNLLTSTKPEEPKEEEPAEEPEEETPPVEEPPKVTTEPNETKNLNGLASLEIEGLTLTPAFSSDVYEYRVIVREDITELPIKAVAASTGATVTIAGNENIQEGENLITIVVYNANGEDTVTYQITTNKSTLDLTETDKMLQMGNQEAKRNAIVFSIIFGMTVVALIVVMILRQRNSNYSKYESTSENEEVENAEQKSIEIEQNTGNAELQSTENEQNVENSSEEIFQERINKREKRKGKHF